MGYLHINNLYKDQDILMFKECYALEKIHGTSAHIKYKTETGITFFSGGEKHARFVELFDVEGLTEKLRAFGVEEITIFGEAYGGKCLGMSGTYGKELKFVAFDVKIDDCWLDVPKAEAIVLELGLEFVWYVRCITDIDKLDLECYAESKQAIRNGMGPGKKMEGVVLRPIVELTKNNGSRVIVKHKRDDFSETKTPRVVSPEKLKILSDAKEVAEEWVTPMRLNHVLDKIEGGASMEKMRTIISAMIEDVKREGEGEIEWSQTVAKAIGKATAVMTKQYFQNKLHA
jgi:hypothetical protein